MKVAAGGIMTPERCNSMWPEYEYTCKCGHWLPDEIHLYWLCPCLQDDTRKEIADTNWMTNQALVEMGVKPGPEQWTKTPLRTMWLRGLIPKKAWPLPQPEDEYEMLEGSWPTPAFKGRICTDGSGGLHSSDVDLRRCGWAVVQTDDATDPKTWRWIAAPLAGSSQTVPRAELTAVLMVIRCAAGDCQAFTDHINIVKTIREGDWKKALASANGDLWGQVQRALEECFWKIEVRWINSHPDDLMMAQTEIPAVAYKGNKMADKKARSCRLH